VGNLGAEGVLRRQSLWSKPCRKGLQKSVCGKALEGPSITEAPLGKENKLFMGEVEERKFKFASNTDETVSKIVERHGKALPEAFIEARNCRGWTFSEMANLEDAKPLV